MVITNGTYCVYSHTNKTNGKIYIGQTCQKPEKRWKNGAGYENCIRFYNAIKKYGWNNFEHEIIASNLTKQEADNFERLLIEKLNTQNDSYGYNICSGGGGTENRQFSDETKQKMKLAKKGKKINQYDKQGNFIRSWDYIRDADKALGINNSSIIRCCRGIAKTAGGFVWRYAD